VSSEVRNQRYARDHDGKRQRYRDDALTSHGIFLSTSDMRGTVPCRSFRNSGMPPPLTGAIITGRMNKEKTFLIFLPKAQTAASGKSSANQSHRGDDDGTAGAGSTGGAGGTTWVGAGRFNIL
jgi:hypothetical protein